MYGDSALIIPKKEEKYISIPEIQTKSLKILKHENKSDSSSSESIREIRFTEEIK